MFGENPIRTIKKGDGTSLEVVDIFSTFQGEGPYAGWPATFIRLGGCNLQCKFCDTEFEDFTERSLDDIVNKVTLYKNILVVITGGEPFRQPISLLCECLIDNGYHVQIETNGTLYQPIHEEVDIICSPKNTGRNYQPIRSDLLERLTAIKFIISAHVEAYGDIADVGQSTFSIPVYVQPMDEYVPIKNKKNLERTLEVAKQHHCRISLQTHKYLEIA